MLVLGKTLMLVGLVLAVFGALLWLAPRQLRWLGHLPGDVRTEHFYFPIVSCLIVSLVLTIVLNLFARLVR
jgi:hypothetical protein